MFKKLLVLGSIALIGSACAAPKIPPSSLSPTVAPTPTENSALTSSTVAATIPLEMKGTNSTGLPLTVPTGFTLATYSKDLVNPRVIIFDSKSTALVSIPNQNKIVAIKDGGESKKDLITGVKAPHGLSLVCEANCKLYVGETDGISSFDYNSELVKATNGKRILELPAGGRHTTKTLQVISTPGGEKLLISIGSSCDVCVEKDNRRASVMIADLDGKNARIFASGLRNSVFMEENPQSHQIWATEMGRDYLGDELPPDEINILQDGKNYGWPLCYGKNVHDTDFDKKINLDNPCKEPSYTSSQIDLPAHSAPLGLTFVTTENWPSNLRNNLLVSYHGSWNRSSPTGYKVVRITLDKDGAYTSKEDFLAGWLDSTGKSVGRPVGLTFDNNGNLFISDDKLGAIYKLTYTK